MTTLTPVDTGVNTPVTNSLARDLAAPNIVAIGKNIEGPNAIIGAATVNKVRRRNTAIRAIMAIITNAITIAITAIAAASGNIGITNAI